MSPFRVVLRETAGQRGEEVQPAADREYLLYSDRVFEFFNVKEEVPKFEISVYSRASS